MNSPRHRFEPGPGADPGAKGNRRTPQEPVAGAHPEQATPASSSPGRPGLVPVQQVVRLQRLAGNHAVQRLVVQRLTEMSSNQAMQLAEASASEWIDKPPPKSAVLNTSNRDTHYLPVEKGPATKESWAGKPQFRGHDRRASNSQSATSPEIDLKLAVPGVANSCFNFHVKLDESEASKQAKAAIAKQAKLSKVAASGHKDDIQHVQQRVRDVLKQNKKSNDWSKIPDVVKMDVKFKDKSDAEIWAALSKYTSGGAPPKKQQGKKK